MAKGILIDPIARTVTAVEVNDGIAEQLGCQWFDIARWAPGEDLYVDDEGLLTYPNPRGYFSVGGALFAGRGLLLGTDRSGEAVDTSYDVERVTRIVEWVDTPPQTAVEPSFTFVPLDEDT